MSSDLHTTDEPDNCFQPDTLWRRQTATCNNMRFPNRSMWLFQNLLACTRIDSPFFFRYPPYTPEYGYPQPQVSLSLPGFFFFSSFYWRVYIKFNSLEKYFLNKDDAFIIFFFFFFFFYQAFYCYPLQQRQYYQQMYGPSPSSSAPCFCRPYPLPAGSPWGAAYLIHPAQRLPDPPHLFYATPHAFEGAFATYHTPASPQPPLVRHPFSDPTGKYKYIFFF